MITLLASIAGFISSIIPDLMRLFLDKTDKKHEIELLKYQIQISEKGLESKISELSSINDTQNTKALYTTYKIGINWVDSLNGTVRPVLAYSFFFIYSFTKFLQFKVLEATLSIAHLELLWSPEDQAIFAGIISFYYGQRSIAKLRK